MSDINIVVVRIQTLTKNFGNKREAEKWIERNQEKDRKDELSDQVHYEIWHSPYPASE